MKSMSLVEVAGKANTAFDHVPIIDLANVDSKNPEDRKLLTDAIKDACINVGFLYVKNHGIPEEHALKTIAAAEEFFSWPIEKKMELDITKSGNFKGYNALRTSNTDPENDGDMHEGFEIIYEDLALNKSDKKREQDGVMTGANVWPTGITGFREALLTYCNAAVDLGKKLFPLFALALDLPENFFEDKTQNSAAIMRILHYPPQTGPMDDRVIGIGAHTDYECFTILWQQPGIQCLQVLNTEKKWIDAPPIPGTLVINLGDQFARWTNDIFKSTVHRAINRNGVERYSIPLFFGTDYHVRLEPIPNCVSPERPPKYEVVTAGEYLKERLKATYGH